MFQWNCKNTWNIVAEEELRPVSGDPFLSSAASSGPSTSDSGQYSRNETVLSDTQVLHITTAYTLTLYYQNVVSVIWFCDTLRCFQHCEHLCQARDALLFV